MSFYSQPGDGRHFALSIGYARGPETRIYTDSLDDTPSIDALVEMLNARPLLRIATALEATAGKMPTIAERMFLTDLDGITKSNARECMTYWEDVSALLAAHAEREMR